MTQIRDWRETRLSWWTFWSLLVAALLPKPPIMGPWHFLLDGLILVAAGYIGWPWVRRLLATWE